MTINEIIDTMKPILDFKYATVDRLSVKLWKDKPKFDSRSKCWLGDSCVGMLDLIDQIDISEFASGNEQIKYSNVLREI